MDRKYLVSIPVIIQKIVEIEDVKNGAEEAFAKAQEDSSDIKHIISLEPNITTVGEMTKMLKAIALQYYTVIDNKCIVVLMGRAEKYVMAKSEKDAANKASEDISFEELNDESIESMYFELTKKEALAEMLEHLIIEGIYVWDDEKEFGV